MDICRKFPHTVDMEELPAILIVDDESVMRDSIGRVVAKDGYPFDTAATGADCLKKAKTKHFDIVLLDLNLPDIPGEVVLEDLVHNNPDTKVIIITGHASVENAVKTLRRGAVDFLAKPFSPNELRGSLERLVREIRLVRENELLRRRIKGHGDDQIIVGKSKIMRDLISLVEKVAPTDSTILLSGESGTGKEIISRAIHEKSHRVGKAFVPIDCNSLVETLLESELFGHVKGSFTGARETKHGYFELAGGGTMFFDEVGNLPMSIQAKLLRVLQTRQFTPVGSTRPINADVRILAATNRDLQELIALGQFREDLFYRLNVVPVRLPPLRDRKEDVPLLVDYFIERFNRRRAVPIRHIHQRVIDLLVAYHWPGNVRELENSIERALILQEGDELTADSLPVKSSERHRAPQAQRPLTMAEVEREHIVHVLALTGGNRSKAASLMGLDRKTLYNKIKKYGLESA